MTTLVEQPPSVFEELLAALAYDEALLEADRCLEPVERLAFPVFDATP
jgi:hypothetical protein